MVLDVILNASAERSSIEAACQDLEGVTGSSTVRAYLNAALKVGQLQEQDVELNAALAASIQEVMKREGIEVAIEWRRFWGLAKSVGKTWGDSACDGLLFLL